MLPAAAMVGAAAAPASDDSNTTGYFVDTLLRPGDPAKPAATLDHRSRAPL